MRLTLALVGGHGVGKSTLGAALAARLGAPFHDEIGRRLLDRRPPGRTAADPQEDFDAAVFAAELDRDARWDGALRVVETWHPGNLAYAARRSPAVAERHRATLTRLGPALVLPVQVTPATAHARQNEPGDPDFFAQVGQEAVAFARKLGLTVLDPVHNDGPLELSVRAALARLPFRMELR